jgi:hypothetical protein
MSLGTYSSIAAFLAHYDVLRATHADSTPAANAPHPDDAVRLAEMNGIIAELTAGDRDALTRHDALIRPAAASSGDAARHRARAELHLRRILAARGILAG